MASRRGSAIRFATKEISKHRHRNLPSEATESHSLMLDHDNTTPPKRRRIVTKLVNVSVYDVGTQTTPEENKDSGKTPHKWNSLNSDSSEAGDEEDEDGECPDGNAADAEVIEEEDVAEKDEDIEKDTENSLNRDSSEAEDEEDEDGEEISQLRRRNLTAEVREIPSSMLDHDNPTTPKRRRIARESTRHTDDVSLATKTPRKENVLLRNSGNNLGSDMEMDITEVAGQDETFTANLESARSNKCRARVGGRGKSPDIGTGKSLGDWLRSGQPGNQPTHTSPEAVAHRQLPGVGGSPLNSMRISEGLADGSLQPQLEDVSVVESSESVPPERTVGHSAVDPARHGLGFSQGDFATGTPVLSSPDASEARESECVSFAIETEVDGQGTGKSLWDSMCSGHPGNQSEHTSPEAGLGDGIIVPSGLEESVVGCVTLPTFFYRRAAGPAVSAAKFRKSYGVDAKICNTGLAHDRPRHQDDDQLDGDDAAFPDEHSAEAQDEKDTDDEKNNSSSDDNSAQAEEERDDEDDNGSPDDNSTEADAEQNKNDEDDKDEFPDENLSEVQDGKDANGEEKNRKSSDDNSAQAETEKDVEDGNGKSPDGNSTDAIDNEAGKDADSDKDKNFLEENSAEAPDEKDACDEINNWVMTK